MSEIFESYDGTIKPPDEAHYMSKHADHCIESQHHGTNEFYPRRKLEKFEAIEGFFPKQDIMLLNVESKIKKSLILEFTYSNDINISREVSENDLVRVFFIGEDNNLTELIGKIYNINYQYSYIEIDCSKNYGRKEYKIPVISMRFISNDLNEVPPFISKEKPEYTHPSIDECINEWGYDYECYISKLANKDEIFEPIMYIKPIIPKVQVEPTDNI